MIQLVAAMDEAGGIGFRGALPLWNAAGDLKRFRKLTMGTVVVMGRRTFDDLGRPLPGRANIVVTSRMSIPGVICANSIDEAIEIVGSRPCSVIGGRKIFEAFLPYCSQAAL